MCFAPETAFCMQMPHAATAAAAVGCVVYMNFGVNFQLSLLSMLRAYDLKWGHSPIDAKTHFPQGGKYTNHLRTQTQL